MNATTIFLLLGGNLGARFLNLKLARKQIEDKIGGIKRSSSTYQTAAWGVENQPFFLNQVLEIETLLPPQELLSQIHQIEKQLGRERYQKWYARTVDIDILYYGNLVIKESQSAEKKREDLTIPHAFLHKRRFTLVPLAEIASDFVHPILQKTNQELLLECPDQLLVEKISKHSFLNT